MKRARQGSRWLSLTPDEILRKLATLVPPPRVHGLRYHGVFAPHARLRRRVVPEAHQLAGGTAAPATEVTSQPDTGEAGRGPDAVAAPYLPVLATWSPGPSTGRHAALR
jgi:hypothetical protein